MELAIPLIALGGLYVVSKQQRNENELDMGTKFDDFTKNAYHLSKEINKNAKINRRLLLSIMTLAGFDFYHKEWWHYQLFNAKDYPLIDNFFDTNIN